MRTQKPSHLQRIAMLCVTLSTVAGCASSVTETRPARLPELPELTQDVTAATATAPHAAPAPAAAPLPAAVALTVQLARTASLQGGPVRNGDAWARMRAGFAIAHLAMPSVAQYQRAYAAQPEFLNRSAQRAAPYFQHIVAELERSGMPTDLALLPVIDSGFDPHALSPAAAAGIWQFIPETGRRYGLRKDWLRDQRRDPLAATAAARDYLRDLFRMFGDWHLALAAYNCGEGNVARAIERARAAGQGRDFASISAYLPDETRAYVPRFIAVRNLFMDPHAWGIRLPALDDTQQFVQMSLGRDADLVSVARLAGMPQEELATLNAGVLRQVISGAETSLWLPQVAAQRVRAALQGGAAGGSALMRLKPVQAVPFEKLSAFALRHGMSETEVRSINGIAGSLATILSGVLFVPLRPQEQAPRFELAGLAPLRMQGEERLSARPHAPADAMANTTQALWLANGWAPGRLQLLGSNPQRSRRGPRPH